MATSYQKQRKEEQRDKVQDALEAYVQEGARVIIARLKAKRIEVSYKTVQKRIQGALL